jgi:hypothetical protein
MIEWSWGNRQVAFLASFVPFAVHTNWMVIASNQTIPTFTSWVCAIIIVAGTCLSLLIPVQLRIVNEE